MQQDADEFFADPFRAHLADGGGVIADGPQCFGVDLEVEDGGEADGPQEAQPVFPETLVGVPNRAEEAGL